MVSASLGMISYMQRVPYVVVLNGPDDPGLAVWSPGEDQYFTAEPCSLGPVHLHKTILVHRPSELPPALPYSPPSGLLTHPPTPTHCL